MRYFLVAALAVAPLTGSAEAEANRVNKIGAGPTWCDMDGGSARRRGQAAGQRSARFADRPVSLLLRAPAL